MKVNELFDKYECYVNSSVFCIYYPKEQKRYIFRNRTGTVGIGDCVGDRWKTINKYTKITKNDIPKFVLETLLNLRKNDI